MIVWHMLAAMSPDVRPVRQVCRCSSSRPSPWRDRVKSYSHLRPRPGCRSWFKVDQCCWPPGDCKLISCWSDADEMLIHGEMVIDWFYFHTLFWAAAMDSSGQAMSNGYVLSKLAAERFVHRAFRNGLQGAVFRPGMLWGNSTTGCRERAWDTYISCFSWESIGTDFLLSNTLDKACHSCSWSRADCFKLLCMRWGKESLSTWIQSAETMQTTGVASFISFPVQVAAIPTSFLLALSPAALVLAVLLRRDLHVMWLRWTTLPRSGIEWNWCQIHCSGQRAKTIQNT